MPRRPILVLLLVAVATTLGIVAFVESSRDRGHRADVGSVAPEIDGLTLDDEAFRLTAARGHPIVVNFWGPSCVPCREEFPLLAAKLSEHADDGLLIVGVLTDDPPAPARDFVAAFGATWPTVVDPDEAIKDRYRVTYRPQTYFIDADGVIRSIQYGEVRDADFERHYARIAP